MYKNSSKLLRYPLDVIDSTTDYMFLEVLEYKPGGVPTLAAGGGAGAATASNSVKGVFGFKKSAKSSIVLPVPNTVSTVNRTGWGESKLSALAGTGLAAAGIGLNKLTGQGDQDLETFIRSQIPTTRGGFDVYRNFVRSKASVAVVNAVAGSSISLNDVLGRTSGQIVNQNVELLFNSVSLRPFGFNWDLTPRNKNESQAVLQIIKTLKIASAAKRELGANGFLQAPDVFRLSYKKGIDDQKFLNKFKICALTSVGVDYTGSGIHATYDDGTPVHYRLNLSFTELEPVYADDYDQVDADEAGF
tara:strand:- start:5248 stop:6156 length:909 start_codon:yes stop_codon:yes gene_type:complete